MASLVGSKGQVVIEKAIRDQLGVQPGWQALQVVVNDHVAIYFIPPEHEESLLGAARPLIRRHPSPDEDWDEAVMASAAEDFLRKSEEG
jgi:bifunctional DNA-binding transcriptional regulator/antitoxin component of YhaV-PrlF toxin-antitoxin module